jgi:hypothetical protein
MNAKQAVTAVLNHQTPPYIPLGTYAIDCDTVERIVGHETAVCQATSLSHITGSEEIMIHYQHRNATRTN